MTLSKIIDNTMTAKTLRVASKPVQFFKAKNIKQLECVLLK